MVTWLEIPSVEVERYSPKQFLHQRLVGDSTEATLLSTRELEIDGHPGIEAVLKAKTLQGQLLTKMRYYVVGDKYYTQAVGATNEKALLDSGQAVRFFGSFRLLGRNGQTSNAASVTAAEWSPPEEVLFPARNKEGPSLAGLMSLSLRHLSDNEFQKAIDAASELVRAAPRGSQGERLGLEYRALAYQGLKRFNEALDDLNEVVNRWPDVKSYSLRGLLYCELGEYDKAGADYNRATEYNLDSKWLQALKGALSGKHQ